MKLKDGLSKNRAGDDYIVISDNREIFKGMIRLNESGAFLFDLLKNDISFDELKNALMNKYAIDGELAKRDLSAFLKTFKDCGLIENE